MSLVYIVLTIIGSGMGIHAMIRAKRRRRRALEGHAAMSAWAEANGWRAVEGIDLRYHAVAELITGLAGQPPGVRPSLRIGGGGVDTFTPARKWEYGTILIKRVSQGEMVIVDCWYEDDGAHHLFASMPTSPGLGLYTFELPGLGEPREDGERPPMFGGFTPLDAFEGLQRPARLQIIANRIVLYTAMELSTDIVERLARRLNDVSQAVRVDGASPMR